MESNSQLGSGSRFGRDRQRGTGGEDRERQIGVVDSDETLPPSQPLDQLMTQYGSSDATGNPNAKEILSPEGLWLVPPTSVMLCVSNIVLLAICHIMRLLN